MKPNLALILAITIALGALPLTTEGSWGRGGGGHGGGHGGGGHGGGHFGGGHGGGHFGGGHFGGHFGGGHFRGGHFGGGHFGGGHFGRSHFGGGRFGGGRFGGGQFGGGRFGGRNQFAGGRQFGGRSGFNRNAFGTRGGWNRFAGNGAAGAWGGSWGGSWGGWGGGWGGWGGWVGPVFWPFLLGDIFSYALWPYDYYYPFWSYGTALDYDYGPYVPPYGYYGYGDLSNIYGGSGRYGRRYATRTNQIPPDVTQSCGGFGPGVTSFPIDQIRQAIHPTGDQITFLNDLADASSKASAILAASCPSEPPLTPLARLDAVEKRLQTTIQAIGIVRPALANLYDSLSDDQRQRLDAIGADEARSERASSNATTLASLCGDQAASFTRLPAQRIEEIVKPTGQQQSALEKLRQASDNAANELRTSCPTRTPDTPMARLDAMNSRLAAMIEAVKTVRPALFTFYASLSDEQKAQFNTMGQQTRTE